MEKPVTKANPNPPSVTMKEDDQGGAIGTIHQLA